MINIKLHFKELKLRLIFILITIFNSFIFSYLYIDILVYLSAFSFLKYKLKNFFFQTDFIFTNILEAFYSYLVMAVATSLYVTLPIFLYTTISFIQIGLFLYEKEQIYILIGNMVILFLLSLCFFYKFLLPSIFIFFLNFEEINKKSFFTLKLEQKIIDYIYFIFFY
jgi:Sec-independent protein secretion pathway component TatC